MPTDHPSRDPLIDHDPATLSVPLRARGLRADQVAHAVERAAHLLEREGMGRWGTLLDQDYDGRTLKLAFEGNDQAYDAAARARFETILVQELDRDRARLEEETPPLHGLRASVGGRDVPC